MSAVSKKLLLSVAVTLVLCLPMIVFAATTDTTPKKFIPELPLPGIFTEANDDSSLMSVYIRATYIFFVWIVGLLGVIMIIYGGIRWVAARGNPGQIKEARETVTNAIAGVMLALLTVVLLNTISPQLTKLATLQLTKVTAKGLNYSSELGCYQQVLCPEGYEQTYGGACGNGGVWTHVNPGERVCAGTQAKAVCCKSTTSNTCIEINSVNLEQKSLGACSAVNIAYSTYCSDQTACGVKNTKSACRGTYCANQGVCHLQDDDLGSCIPGEGKQRIQVAGCQAFDLNFSQDLDCGTITAVYPSTGAGTAVKTIGTNPSVCGAGKRCLFVEPNKIVSASTTSIQCSYSEKQGSNPIVYIPMPTVCK